MLLCLRPQQKGYGFSRNAFRTRWRRDLWRLLFTAGASLAADEAARRALDGHRTGRRQALDGH